MKISKQARREAKQLFRSCAVNGQLEENAVRGTVSRILEAKPRGYLATLTHFQRLVKQALEQRTACIESPVPLTPSVQAEVQADLSRSYGSGLDVSFVHNPRLIGGLRIKVGSDVYDGSIQGRLAALEESF